VRPAGRFATRRPLAAALLLLAGVLAATADERIFGLVTDGRMAVRSAVSMVTLGEIGIARGEAVGVDRPGGDSVSRYGMGFPITLVVPAFFAEGLDRRAGPGASQTLFVGHQILLLIAASAGAGGLARAWGGDRTAVFRAALATVLASPLLAYAGADFSEPLQAALAAATFAAGAGAAARNAAPRRALLLAAGAGAAAGFALLTKSLLVVLLPVGVVLAASSGGAGERVRRASAAVLAWLPFAGLWLAFEVVRFGHPFGGYAGERFSHPLPDGLWRLTVGPNKGLLLYFPLLALSAVGAATFAKRNAIAAGLGAGFVLFLLVTSAAWWAWDGTFGWGPRLLLAGIPVLAVFAALGAAQLRPAVFRVLFGLGVAVNALGLFAPATLTMWYLKVLPRRSLTAAVMERYPAFAFDRDAATGGALLDNQFWVSSDAALSPIRLSAWLLLQELRGGDLRARLNGPPWSADGPGHASAPVERALDPSQLGHFVAPWRWPHLGMSFFRSRRETSWALAEEEALLDQANRAQDMRRADRAVDFGERLWAILPGPQSAVVLAEGYRLAGRRETLAALAPRLSARRPAAPGLGIVLALFARDLGDEAGARRILAEVAASAPQPEFWRLLEAPLASWPATLRDVTGENRRPRG
jgi:hypothetical protein